MKSFLAVLIFTCFSCTLFGQENALQFYSSSDDVWLNALSKTESHAAIKKMVSSFGPPNELNDFDEIHEALAAEKQKAWYKKGIKIGFSKMPLKSLNNIYFYKKNSAYTSSHNKLPFGISFSDTAKKIKSRYGKYITKVSKDNIIVQVHPARYPFVFLNISMDEGKVGHAVTLLYDEFSAYKSTSSPHDLEDDLDLCEAYSAMVKDVDNKFFSFRGEKTKGVFSSWESNVILDTDDVAYTTVFSEYIKIVGYEGIEHDEAALAIDTLYGYFNMCVEDGEIPYSWKETEKQTDTAWKITLTTKEENLKVVHHFEMKEQFFNGKYQDVYSAYTLIRFSED